MSNEDILVVKGKPHLASRFFASDKRSVSQNPVALLSAAKLYSPGEFVIGRFGFSKSEGITSLNQADFIFSDSKTLDMYEKGLTSGRYIEIGRVDGDLAQQIREYAHEALDYQEQLNNSKDALIGSAIKGISSLGLEKKLLKLK